MSAAQWQRRPISGAYVSDVPAGIFIDYQGSRGENALPLEDRFIHCVRRFSGDEKVNPMYRLKIGGGGKCK